MASPQRHVIRVRDADALAEAAARRLLDRVGANAGRVAICLTGGSSPKKLYELLATDRYRNAIPWDRAHWFIGDDRFVPQDNSLSNIGMARRAFLDRCAPPDHVHAIPTDADSPEEAARHYAATLQSFYGATVIDPGRPLFDLVLMGLGPDGHTASLFPGFPAIDETERWVVGVPKANVEPFVPRVSLTLPTLNACREMLFEVSGQSKRAILARVLGGEDLPAARAHAADETVWLCDEAAFPESAGG